eukprot:6469923-Prymnesium_polylepis.2
MHCDGYRHALAQTITARAKRACSRRVCILSHLECVQPFHVRRRPVAQQQPGRRRPCAAPLWVEARSKGAEAHAGCVLVEACVPLRLLAIKGTDAADHPQHHLRCGPRV